MWEGVVDGFGVRNSWVIGPVFHGDLHPVTGEPRPFFRGNYRVHMVVGPCRCWQGGMLQDLHREIFLRCWRVFLCGLAVVPGEAPSHIDLLHNFGHTVHSSPCDAWFFAYRQFKHTNIGDRRFCSMRAHHNWGIVDCLV
ncbi:hypothetical protein AVEN_99086-1 [Araneus ventricosus]|uniref:Uncharacterized protein n=1 Tax=Araneus ventricosus TaxID=182803 RepID=A0A4Y2R7V9_ARAVE|nr:hypothetical protein AVEN_99086-1 [Araneus ventricosus]